MSILPPPRRTGPLTPSEQEHLRHLQERAAQQSGEVISIAERQNRAQFEARLNAFDRAMNDAIEECAPWEKARLKDGGWNSLVKNRRGNVPARGLRAYMEGIAARIRAFVVAQYEDDEDHDLDPLSDQSIESLVACVVAVADCWDPDFKGKMK
jgi:hypothetical protein